MKKSTVVFLCFIASMSLYGQQSIPVRLDTIRVEIDKLPIDRVLSEEYTNEKFLYDGYLTSKNVSTFRGANEQSDAQKGLDNYQKDSIALNYYELKKENKDAHFKIHIIVTDEIERPVDLRFPIAEYKDKQWTIVKDHIITLMPETLEQKSVAKEDSQTNNAIDAQDWDGKKSSGHISFIENNKLEPPHWLIAILVAAFLLMVVWCSMLTMRITKLSRVLDNQTNGFNAALSRIQANKPHVPTTSEIIDLIRKENPGTVSPNVMQKIAMLVDEKINQAMPKYDSHYGPSCAKGDSVITPNNPEKPLTEFRSSNIIYDAVTNTFSVSDEVSIRIFEIFEKNGEYFLTLVDDPTIRHEFISVLGNYEKCIKVIQEASFPVKADVLDNAYGHLFKDGDFFRVDSTQLLNIVLR